eukprot:415426-Rhodomonas_salina.1
MHVRLTERAQETNGGGGKLNASEVLRGPTGGSKAPRASFRRQKEVPHALSFGLRCEGVVAARHFQAAEQTAVRCVAIRSQPSG